MIHPVDDAQRMVTATKDLRALAARFATSLQAQAYTLPMLFWVSRSGGVREASG